MEFTLAYKCFEFYRNNYFQAERVQSYVDHLRDFYAGKQYADDSDNGIPKPVINICREYVEKEVAKILETPIYVEFISDLESESLNKLDDFYDYQRKQIGDESLDYEVAKTGFIDGTAVVFTIYDEDTIGCESKYRGYLKRSIIPFEQTFWANPYIQDPQDQEYLGYVFPMTIRAIKNILEDDSKENLENVVPEDYFDNNGLYDNRILDSLETNVYVRLFRVKGEVAFEMSTKYVNIFKSPHFLNPTKNDIKLKVIDEDDNKDKHIADYVEMDDPKYNLFHKAMKGSNKELKSKFNRYPVTLFRPLPRKNRIDGESPLNGLINLQKVVNSVYQQQLSILQAQSAGKIIVKPEALKGQTYNGDPAQVLVDYTPMSRGVAWGINRLNGDGGVSASLIGQGNHYIDVARQICGFENLNAVANTDTSGYAYQQMISQSNLMLVQPQKRFWEYKAENAKVDLNYFKFYIDEALYFTIREPSQINYLENNREMLQDITNRGGAQNILPQGTELPNVEKIQSHSIKGTDFDRDFQIVVSVESGIAKSLVSESQHYQQVMQFILSGNANADMVKVMLENDPAFSRKLKQSVATSLKNLEISQLARKDEEINQLKQLVNSLAEKLKVADGNIKFASERYKALEKASQENAKMNMEFLKAKSNNVKSESEVKSDNAKGISGGSFS